MEAMPRLQNPSTLLSSPAQSLSTFQPFNTQTLQASKPPPSLQASKPPSLQASKPPSPWPTPLLPSPLEFTV